MHFDSIFFGLFRFLRFFTIHGVPLGYNLLIMDVTKSKEYQLFTHIIKEMISNSIYSQDLDTMLAYQPANKKNCTLVDTIIAALLYKNSTIHGIEHFETLGKLASQGKSCLLLPEHYSNFDVPALFYLIRSQYSQYAPILDQIICLAAAKLSTESKTVLAFAESFNRIMIYPARSKLSENDEGYSDDIAHKIDSFNHRAIEKMMALKNEGNIILMFPSGTRYRPQNPDSRNALEQVASFIKRFDYVCFLSLDGNLLKVNPNNKMEQDIACRDTMVYYFEEPIPSRDYLSMTKENASSNQTDYKRGVAQHVTSHLLALHQYATKIRTPLIAETPPQETNAVPLTLTKTLFFLGIFLLLGVFLGVLLGFFFYEKMTIK